MSNRVPDVWVRILHERRLEVSRLLFPYLLEGEHLITPWEKIVAEIRRLKSEEAKR